MGLGISIFIALPVGAVVGCCLGPCATKAFEASPLKRQCCSFRTLLFPSLLAIGVLGLFVPLFVLCARYDGVSVSTALTEGACWSTGVQAYTGLGFAAGIITGIGLTGCVWLLIALLRSRAADKDQSLQVVDVEQGSEAIVNDSDCEQDSNNNNTTITVS
mmetsp:Transcript_31239/g.40405  ORF Transcript_31239/g.40405 Transcript_31239/m.40405 type:complete len:160 (-) Transcript_31239:260-739(-)